MATKKVGKYYVYFVRLYDEIIYVGMGHGNRIDHVNSGASHSAALNAAYVMNGTLDVKIEFEGMQEEQAKAKEKECIEQYMPECNVIHNRRGMSNRYASTASVAFFMELSQWLLARCPPDTKVTVLMKKDMMELAQQVHVCMVRGRYLEMERGNVADNILKREYRWLDPHVKFRECGAKFHREVWLSPEFVGFYSHTFNLKFRRVDEKYIRRHFDDVGYPGKSSYTKEDWTDTGTTIEDGIGARRTETP